MATKAQISAMQQTQANAALIAAGNTPTSSGWVSSSGSNIGQTTPQATEQQKVKAAAEAADKNVISLSAGYGGSEVPNSLVSKYGETKGFREQRAAEVIKGAGLQEGAMDKTGSDAIYPANTFSPLSSERVETATKQGGTVFLSSGELPPQNERNVGGLPTYNIPMSGGSNVATEKKLDSSPDAAKTDAMFNVGMPGYRPSPMKPAQNLVDVAVESPFNFAGGAVLGASGRFSPASISKVGVVVDTQSDLNPFTGSTGKVLSGVPAPPTVSQTLFLGDMGTTTYKKSEAEARQFYYENQAKKQQEAIAGTIADYKTKGYIVGTYEWEDPTQGKVIKFSQPVRDTSLLPATPTERTEKLVSPFGQAWETANTGNILGAILPASAIVNLGLPEGKKIEYKSESTRIAADFIVSGVAVVGEEVAVKPFIGSYYRFAPIEFGTQKQLDEFKASPEKKKAYSELSQSQLEGSQFQSAVNIETMGLFAIGGEVLPIARGLVKSVPVIGKTYAPSGAAMTYVPGERLAGGKGREGVFNPVTVESGKVVQYIPEQPGIFNRLGSNVITENEVVSTQRVISSKQIDKLPSLVQFGEESVGKPSEGATVKFKRTVTVYPETQFGRTGSFTTGYSVKGEVYASEGKPNIVAGELGTIEQQVAFFPKRGEAEFYTYKQSGIAATKESIPIDRFAVGTIKTNAPLSKEVAFSTGNVYGEFKTQPSVYASFNEKSGLFEVNPGKVGVLATKSDITYMGNRAFLEMLQTASTYNPPVTQGLVVRPEALDVGLLGRYNPASKTATINIDLLRSGSVEVARPMGEKLTISSKQVFEHEATHDVFEYQLSMEEKARLKDIASEEYYKQGTRLPNSYPGAAPMVQSVQFENELLAFTTSNEMQPRTTALKDVNEYVRRGFFKPADTSTTNLLTSNIPIEESGYKTFGTIYTTSGKPAAMVEYFGKGEPKPIELEKEPTAITRGGKKTEGISTQITMQKEPPVSLKVAQAMEEKTITRTESGGTSTKGGVRYQVEEYDKPMQIERTFAGVAITQKVASSQGLRIGLATSPGLKAFQPTATVPELKTFTEEPVAFKVGTSQPQPLMQMQETKMPVITPEKVPIPFEPTGTPNITNPPPERPFRAGGFFIPGFGDEGGKGKKFKVKQNLRDLLSIDINLRKKGGGRL